jgi:hypothetical protein
MLLKLAHHARSLVLPFCFVSFFSPVNADTAELVVDANGILKGATGVLVNGHLYDVEFVDPNALVQYIDWTHPALNRNPLGHNATADLRWSLFLSTSNGPVLSTRALVSELNLNSVLVWPLFRRGDKVFHSEAVKPGAPIIGLDIETGVGAGQATYRNAFYCAFYSGQYFNTPFSAKFTGVRLVRTSRFVRAIGPRLDKAAERSVRIERKSTDWEVLTAGNVGPPLADFGEIGQFLVANESLPGLVFEWHFEHGSFESQSDILSRSWMEFVGTPWLALDRAKRITQSDAVASALGSVFHQVVRAFGEQKDSSSEID